MTWRLTWIEDPTGRVVGTPTGYQVIRFRHTTLIRFEGDDGVRATSADDDRGNHSIVAVDSDHIHFADWTNGLVRLYSTVPARPPRPDIPSGPLTIDETRFVFSVLAGTATWSLQEDKLTVAKPNVGSLTFEADRGA